MYFSAFSICFCNPSGASDIPTKSSANINPDTVSSPIVTPCYAASTAAITLLVYTLNRLGDSVHPCATPCKISTYLDISPSSIAAFHAHSIIIFIVLRTFPLIPIPHIFSKTHSSILCHRPSVHLGREKYGVSPVSFLPLITSSNVYTWSTQLRFGLNPACPSRMVSSSSNIVSIISFKILRCSIALSLGSSPGQLYLLSPTSLLLLLLSTS